MALWRRRVPREDGDPGEVPPADRGTASDASGPEEVPITSLAAERVASHFPAGRAEGDLAVLGLGDLTVQCHVEPPSPFGAQVAVPLYFLLRGTVLGPDPVFASFSGYHDDPVGAVVEGACLWTCTARPLLAAAARHALPGEEGDAVEVREVGLTTGRFTVLAQGMHRAAGLGGAVDTGERLRAATGRVPTGWMTFAVLASPDLPPLPRDRVTVLSTFQSLVGSSVNAEVKVQGVDHPVLEAAMAPDGPEPEGAMVLLRELAVVLPVAD